MFKVIEEEFFVDMFIYCYCIIVGVRDGLEGEEGIFFFCFFWYIENLAKVGQVIKVRLYFEKMFGYVNYFGLFLEMIVLNGEQVGNFLQVFMYLVLISVAL